MPRGLSSVPTVVTTDPVEALLAEHPVIDGHNDLLWTMRDMNGYDFAAYDVGHARTRPQRRAETRRLGSPQEQGRVHRLVRRVDLVRVEPDRDEWFLAGTEPAARWERRRPS